MRQSPKIIINASTVKMAGGLVVANDIIRLLISAKKFELILICPDIPKYRNLKGNITKIYTPGILLNSLLRIMLDFLWLPLKVKRMQADLVITLGNLPLKTSTTQLMFNDNAFVTEKNLYDIPLSGQERIKHSIRKKFFWYLIKYVDLLVVQTNTEYNKLSAFNMKFPRARVIPPLLPAYLTETAKPLEQSYKFDSDSIKLVCLSYYWSHKNIEILQKVLDLAEKEEFKLQIIFSLNEKKRKGGKKVIQNLRPLINNGMAINIGNITHSRIKTIIGHCDGVILPSITETFGLNCLEAWNGRKPFFVSDLPFANEVCGKAALYFNPKDPKSILECVKESFASKHVIEKVVNEGLTRIRRWSYNEEYLKVIDDLLGS